MIGDIDDCETYFFRSIISIVLPAFLHAKLLNFILYCDFIPTFITILLY